MIGSSDVSQSRQYNNFAEQQNVFEDMTKFTQIFIINNSAF